MAGDDTLTLAFDRRTLNRAAVLLLGAAALFGVPLGAEERYRYERVALPESGQIPGAAEDLNYVRVGCDSFYGDRASRWDCSLAYNILDGDVNATTQTDLYPSGPNYRRYLLNGSFYRPVLEPNDPEPTASYRLAYGRIPTADALASLAAPTSEMSSPVANAVRATDEVHRSEGLLWRRVRAGLTENKRKPTTSVAGLSDRKMRETARFRPSGAVYMFNSIGKIGAGLGFPVINYSTPTRVGLAAVASRRVRSMARPVCHKPGDRSKRIDRRRHALTKARTWSTQTGTGHCGREIASVGGRLQ